jgi:putative endonuclease
MRHERQPCAYILASQHHGTLYIGVTSNLIRRLAEHRQHSHAGFTARYHVEKLVYYEMFGDMERAIAREKQWKNWRRAWKIALIQSANPDWHDLAPGFGFSSL